MPCFDQAHCLPVLTSSCRIWDALRRHIAWVLAEAGAEQELSSAGRSKRKRSDPADPAGSRKQAGGAASTRRSTRTSAAQQQQQQQQAPASPQPSEVLLVCTPGHMWLTPAQAACVHIWKVQDLLHMSPKKIKKI